MDYMETTKLFLDTLQDQGKINDGRVENARIVDYNWKVLYPDWWPRCKAIVASKIIKRHTIYDNRWKWYHLWLGYKIEETLLRRYSGTDENGEEWYEWEATSFEVEKAEGNDVDELLASGVLIIVRCACLVIPYKNLEMDVYFVPSKPVEFIQLTTVIQPEKRNV